MPHFEIVIREVTYYSFETEAADRDEAVEIAASLGGECWTETDSELEFDVD